MKRILLLVSGLGAVVLGLFVILGEQFAGTSADATVNAQALVLRAPIAGNLNLEVRQLGTHISKNQHLATITDPRPDDLRLIDLQRSASQLQTELDALKRKVTVLKSAQADYQKQLSAYQSDRVRQIEARLAEASRAVESAQAKLREGEATFRRSAELGRLGYHSQADLVRTRAGYEVQEQDVEAARDRINNLKVQLESAKKGTFISETSNDAPYAQQRIHEIEVQLPQLMVDAEERDRRLAATEKDIDEEKLRLARFTEARIVSPVDGMLWDALANNGEFVNKGQNILRIVDCATTIVTASVRESIYNRLTVGNPAQFQLRGVGRTYTGSVSRLAGSGAKSIYETLAIAPSDEHLKRFDVTLVFPEMNADPELWCTVGRTGRITFTSGPLQFWRDWLAQVGLI
jgi:multidrug resistance efflux pump